MYLLDITRKNPRVLFVFADNKCETLESILNFKYCTFGLKIQ